MELRLLKTELEREAFANCLTEARATRGIRWRETPRSHLGEAHLTFGSIYGIFGNDEDPPERMVGGFIMHDLSTLPQTLSRPDLSHLPPRSVLEGSELWSLSKGVARIAALAAAVVAGISQAKVILLYPMLRPVDLGTPYAQLNFVNASDPVLWPYATTIDGEEIWVQPMILQGEKLEEYIRSGFEFLFKNREGRQVLRFDRPSPAPTREIQVPRSEERTALAVVPASAPEDGNGAASHNGAQR
ncbi:MAG: hypothetical protein ACYDC3_17280 [Candidatus Binataceae bacterium]